MHLHQVGDQCVRASERPRILDYDAAKKYLMLAVAENQEMPAAGL